jgi:hypothetical protein
MPVISQWQVVLGMLLGFITVAFQGEKAIKQALESANSAISTDPSEWTNSIKTFNIDFYTAIVQLVQESMSQNVKDIEMILQRDKLQLYLDNVVGEEAKHFVSLGVKYPLEPDESLPLPTKNPTPQPSERKPMDDQNTVDDQFTVVKAAF